MSTAQPSRESADQFFKASDDLMKMGATFSGNIDVALDSFKLRLEGFLKTNFLERAVAEMLTHSFSEFERDIRTNLGGINKICTEGGQWYAFCFGSALGRDVHPPATLDSKQSPTSKPSTS